MPDRLDRVTVATSRQNPGRVVISWEGREELLERLIDFDGGAAIIERFVGAGASSAVRLTIEEKKVVADVLEGWLYEIGKPSLPDGIFALRNAIIDDLRDASPS